MKKKLLTVLGLTMIVALVTACGSNNAAQPDNAAEATESVEVTEDAEVEEDTEEASEVMTYEFETYDGITIVINEGTILSQEACDNPLEWEGLPADAEQIAPGRDYVLLQDAENFYVEDVTNKLVTVAFRELGDVIEDTDIAIFDNGVFSFSYDPENFTVEEAEGSVNVFFSNEDVQTAGTNYVSFTELINTDAMQQVQTYMGIFGASEDEMVENYLGGDDVKGYSYATDTIEHEDSEKIRETFHAVPCGDNIIFIEKLRTVGDDMDLENSLDAQLDEVILSFKLD